MVKLGEVGLLTNDVPGLASFYKKLLNIQNDCEDAVHQFIIKEETTLSIYNDGIKREGNSQHICIAFTVDNVDAEYQRLLSLGIEIDSPPTIRPWGAKNMILTDPEGNSVIFRSIP